MTTGTVETSDEHASALTERDLEMLKLERSWWEHAGAKESLIRERFDISSTVYYARLIDRREALAADPMLVRRLQRLR
jgi:hypothetical protein